MAVVVNGNAADRAAIEKLLQQLCPLIRVNPSTGAVTRAPGPPAPANQLACCCLDNLLASNFVTTINPLAGPDAIVPDTQRRIDSFTGAASALPEAGWKVAGAGGKMVNGAGAGATTHIDISDNNGDGYSVFDASSKPIDAPQFISLYHELCTGHATLSTQGAVDVNDLETDVIKCENAFRAAQKPPYTQRVGHVGKANAAGAGRSPR